MRVLVTGGCGFLGYHVCAYFREHWRRRDRLRQHGASNEFARNPYMREEARHHNRAELTKAGVEFARRGHFGDKETLTRNGRRLRTISATPPRSPDQ